jgi:quercetin dioxygenase-like cupin family protein/alkylhydroperoxidase/carboxymuconolactone decarboxylase family protein YurZ
MKKILFLLAFLAGAFSFAAIAQEGADMSRNSDAKSMDTLDGKQRQIVHVSAFTATGDLENLKIALNNGLDAGLTINEIREILVQMYAYCGFPRSLNAINTFMTVLEERKAKGISDETGEMPTGFSDKNKYDKGKNTLETLTQRAEAAPTGANAFAPAIDEFLKEHLFADIFWRGVLTYEQRELATLSALSALNGVEPQLQAHVKIGMNVGLTESQIKEIKALGEISPAIFSQGERIANDYFIGKVWLHMLVAPEAPHNIAVGNVTFSPGARNNWHAHRIGQFLLVTSGKGWYQEYGKAARSLQKGDVVNIPAGTKHWHGAAKDSWFVHIAVTPGASEWFEAVTDEEYHGATQK